MTPDELVTSAMHAALLEGLYPARAARPHVTEGSAAATVLLAAQDATWIVAIHLNGAEKGDWHVTGSLPPHTARTYADTYAHTGL